MGGKSCPFVLYVINKLNKEHTTSRSKHEPDYRTRGMISPEARRLRLPDVLVLLNQALTIERLPPGGARSSDGAGIQGFH